jgi:hypothetical protein
VPFEQNANDIVKVFALALAGLLVDDIALWVDYCNRGPAAHAVRLPDGHVPVDYDWVVYFVPAYCFFDVPCFLLIVEFCRVHSDDNYRPALILFLYPLQIRQCVHAVDAAISPKVKNDDMAFQVVKRKRPVGVEPGKALWEILCF